MTSALKGWQIRILGDDVTWIRCAPDGKMYALAPENGIFGSPCGSTPKNSPSVFKLLAKNAVLVNCASTSKGRFYWEALEGTLEEGERVRDWNNEQWTPDQNRPPNHANCRYSAFTSAAPNLHHNWELAAGVQISFVVFGCERGDEMPLVYETESWEHGVVMAAGLRSVSHSALDKPTNVLVHNPLCMRTYLSFNFADFLKLWINIKDRVNETPKIFMVNWYQEGQDGKPIWPGFGENIRVLEWIVKRCMAPQETPAATSAIGLLPKQLNMEGLTVDVSKLLTVNKEFWTKELAEISSFLRVEMGKGKLPIINKILSNIRKRVDALP